jgi:hypothetical protein
MAEGQTTIGAILGFLGGLGAFLSIPALLARRPTYGPRLEPGEIKAGEATAKAEGEYWKAERLAARGACAGASRAWKKAEAYREMARKRAAKGDRTGGDLRDPIRNARDEIRRCQRGGLVSTAEPGYAGLRK